MAQEKHTRAYCVNEKRGYRQILYVVLQNSNKKSKFKKITIFEPILGQLYSNRFKAFRLQGQNRKVHI